jgi:hypothetical protein
VPEECGIWVSVSLGNDSNPGTQAAPVATLKHAVELAEKGPGRVYACNETWTDPLVVPSSVSLYGGFQCDKGWAYVSNLGDPVKDMSYCGKSHASLIVEDDSIAMAWTKAVSGGKPFLTDFYVRTQDAKKPGASSVAMFVGDDVPLSIFRSEFAAGVGATGADGAPGDANNLPAASGMAGNAGGNACSAAVSKGGLGPSNACASGSSMGGAGGDGGPMIAADGVAGLPASNPPAGQGGKGEQRAPACTDGTAGADGADGASGSGGHGEGHMTASGWVGASGKDGAPGAPGQGGGGGGATFGKAAVCGAATPGGAAGGSGGSGGCGGKGGGGGQAGGGSFGIVARSALAGDRVCVRAQQGGNGGNGGAPQLPGTGGTAGKGGEGAGTIKAGCAGGAGGNGGKGGWGGGGAGGPSLPLAYLEGFAPMFLNAEFYRDYPGKGGIGGTPQNLDAKGDDAKNLDGYYGFAP